MQERLEALEISWPNCTREQSNQLQKELERMVRRWADRNALDAPCQVCNIDSISLEYARKRLEPAQDPAPQIELPALDFYSLSDKWAMESEKLRAPSADLYFSLPKRPKPNSRGNTAHVGIFLGGWRWIVKVADKEVARGQTAINIEQAQQEAEKYILDTLKGVFRSL